MDGPVSSLAFEPVKPHTHTVIFLHGRGDTARNFSFILSGAVDSRNRMLAEAFPSFRWVFPSAPGPRREWFKFSHSRNISIDEDKQVAGLRAIVPEIKRILSEEATKLGGRWDRLILAGFSMGSATSLQTLLNLHITEADGGHLAAFIGIAGRCPLASMGLDGIRQAISSDAMEDIGVLKATPVLLEHCADDTTVPAALGRSCRDFLTRIGMDVTYKEYEEGGHWIKSPQGMDDIVAFIERIVGDSLNRPADPTPLE